jgi:acyl carrier protein
MDAVKETLVFKIKTELLEAIGAKVLDPNGIDNEAEIFGPDSALKLDSLDALELISIVERNFELKVNLSNSSRQIFKSFNTLADHIILNSSDESVKKYVNN